MNVLVVHAHPVPESYNAALLAVTTEALASQGHDIEVADLNAGADPDAERLASAEAVVLVYPTWWGGFPGALLDWVQRRLAPWIDDGQSLQSSPLRNVRHLVAVTTHGSSKLINSVQGEPGRQLFERSIAPLCARGVDVRWIALYKIDRATDTERAAFLDRVSAEVLL